MVIGECVMMFELAIIVMVFALGLSVPLLGGVSTKHDLDLWDE